jgi:flagellar basal body-associated protein FliL
MAFCNSCGATLTPGTKFCNKCGTPQAVGTVAPASVPYTPVPAAAPAPVQPTTGGSSALKIILIVIAVIVVIGILGVATVGFIGYRIAKSAHVTQNGDNVKVETPFGSVESSKDPEEAAKDLGIDIYPGAELRKNGAQSASFGNIRTVTANFESSDSADKVCTFYKAKFPGARVSSSDTGRCTIVSNDQKNMVTINVESRDDSSKFQISSVRKK